MASPSRVGNLTGRTLGGGGGDGGGGDATASALLLCIIKSYDNVGECEVQKSPLNPPPPPPFSSHPVLPSERAICESDHINGIQATPRMNLFEASNSTVIPSNVAIRQS
ncbi:hypothetical protein V1477_004211 [Vespula maculifrons]|uniref:Uncharacterized protein n=1 Tax=Vespula maculifrons TaxID=7453 RepID=A0ABD2CQY3_VESMC